VRTQKKTEPTETETAAPETAETAAPQKTDLTVVKAAPIVPVRDQDVDKLLQETARTNPLLRFKEGKFLIREDQIGLGREYIAYPMEWCRGWVCWKDGQIVAHHMVRVVDETERVMRADLGDLDESKWIDEKDPWQPQNVLPLQAVETDQYVIFTTSSVGGRIAIEELINLVGRAYKSGKQSGMPVIALATKPFHTQYGERPRPFFPVLRYHDLPPIKDEMNDDLPF
jgi:hypothetical protein